jgi:L-iditol 2-dehydrogenase
VRFLATPPFNGSLTNYLEHAGDYCFKMPDHMTFEEGIFKKKKKVYLV